MNKFLAGLLVTAVATTGAFAVTDGSKPAATATTTTTTSTDAKTAAAAASAAKKADKVEKKAEKMNKAEAKKDDNKK